MGQSRAVAGAVGAPRGGLEGFFRLREHGTDARTEVLAGLTTFFVMSYIIAVNPAGCDSDEDCDEGQICQDSSCVARPAS